MIGITKVISEIHRKPHIRLSFGGFRLVSVIFLQASVNITSFLQDFDLEQINVIDHSAIISRSANLGDGIYIGKMCLVNCDSTLADGVVINTRSLIEHGNSIGYCTNISTNVVLNGDVNVGTLTFVGSCTVVNGQLTLGSNSVIGSGSVVIRDIPNNVVVAGSPTRLIRKINNE